jgi:hypothetical protein
MYVLKPRPENQKRLLVKSHAHKVLIVADFCITITTMKSRSDVNAGLAFPDPPGQKYQFQAELYTLRLNKKSITF